MKISKRGLEKYISIFLFFLFIFLIYFGMCVLLGIDFSSDLDVEDDGGRFPKGSLVGGISFIFSYLILTKSRNAIVNLKSKEQLDKYFNEFYNFKQRYSYQLSKSSFLLRTIEDVHKNLIDSYKSFVNISDFNDIADYKKSTYELIRRRLNNLIYGPYGFGSCRNADFAAIVELYKDMLEDRGVYNESDSSKYLNELSEWLEEN